MNKQLCLTILLGTLVASAPAHAKLYKWVDDSGAVHYGDKIPPKYSKQQHQELNSRGIQVKAIARKKTAEERSAEQAAQSEEQQRQERERKLAAEQSRKDQILLDTFTVERDINIMRDDRLGAIDSTTNLTNTYNKQLEGQLATTQQQIDNLEKNKREVPDNLMKKVKNLTGQLDKNAAHLARLAKDREMLVLQFKKDLARFRELKGLPPAPEAPESVEEPSTAE